MFATRLVFVLSIWIKKKDIKEQLQASDSLLASTALVKENGYFAGSDYFKQRELTIQDETSQLVAPALEVQPSDQVLDACAARGQDHPSSFLSSRWEDHSLGLVRS